MDTQVYIAANTDEHGNLNFTSVHTLINFTIASGDRSFLPQNMKVWKTRVLKGVYGGIYFVTSEIPISLHGTGRTYVVRSVNSDGMVNTEDMFNDLSEAKSEAKRLARLRTKKIQEENGTVQENG